MTTRRTFLTSVGTALGGAALGTLAMGRSRPLHAIIPPAKLDRIGIQLYTLRSLTAKDLEGTIAKVAGIGYREVEFAGYFGRTPAQVKAMLAANKLTSPSTHLGLPATDTLWQQQLDQAAETGHEWVVIAYLDDQQRGKTEDDWARMADRFNRLASIAKMRGLRFAYHNHDFEFVKAGKGTALDALISRTDPSIVDFEMDIFWVTKAGADPIDLIRRYPHRFPLMHAKDATAAPARDMVDVGRGTIDFNQIFAFADRSGMQHVYVEHDNPTDALESARISYRHLAALR